MNTSAMVAATAGTAAVALLLPGGLRLSPARLRRPGHATLTLGGVALGGTLVVLLDGRTLALGLVGSLAGVAVVHLVAEHRRDAAAERRGLRVLQACDALAAELRAGRHPERALELGAAEWPELGPVAAASRLGADVPEAIRLLSERPGADDLRLLAAAWQVAERTGSGLAQSVARTAGQVRAQRAVRRVVRTELAAAQATARMLAALPFGLLLLGRGVGGDPWGFLLETTPGLGCLTAGLALSWAGARWLGRIARGLR